MYGKNEQTLGAGDLALATPLRLHCAAMNKGGLHSLESCYSSQLSTAKPDYGNFDFEPIKKMTSERRQLNKHAYG